MHRQDLKFLLNGMFQPWCEDENNSNPATQFIIMTNPQIDILITNNNTRIIKGTVWYLQYKEIENTQK